MQASKCRRFDSEFLVRIYFGSIRNDIEALIGTNVGECGGFWSKSVAGDSTNWSVEIIIIRVRCRNPGVNIGAILDWSNGGVLVFIDGILTKNSWVDIDAIFNWSNGGVLVFVDGILFWNSWYDVRAIVGRSNGRVIFTRNI